MPVVTLRPGASEGVRVLTLDDPDRRNALSPQLIAELTAAVAEVAADEQARVLVIAGNGSAFCAGADLPAVFGDTDRSVAEIRRDLRTIYDSFLRVRDLSIPTIAAVNGPAVGAGLNLAFCCDLRVAGPGAKFIASFTRIGLHPGGGCTHFLVRALGPQRALAMLLDGGAVGAAEALATGMVLSVDDDPLRAALALADRYATLEPELSRDITQAVRLATEADLDTVLQFEAWAQASSATGPRLQEAVARFRR